MTTSSRSWYWHLGLAIGGAIASFGNCAYAQTTPDSTQGASGSVVTPTNSSLSHSQTYTMCLTYY